MERIVDLHTHVAPGIDDGARTVSESLELLDAAASQGIASLVATPHVSEDASAEEIHSITGKVQAFQEETQSHAVKVIAGAEVMLRPDLAELLKRHPELCVNRGNKYVLVELPITTYPLYVEQAFFELQSRGLTPVIAHPERYLFTQQSPNQFYRLLRNGALAQATAESFLLPRSLAVRRTVEALVRCGMVQIIASDVHSPSMRTFHLQEAMAVAARWIGPLDAQAMITETPQRVVSGEKVDTFPQPYKRSWRLRLR